MKGTIMELQFEQADIHTYRGIEDFDLLVLASRACLRHFTDFPYPPSISISLDEDCMDEEVKIEFLFAKGYYERSDFYEITSFIDGFVAGAKKA